MLILPMVGVLHRALTAILRLGKKLGPKRRQRRTLLQNVIAAKTKTRTAQNKRQAGNPPAKRGRKGKPSATNLVNAAPNTKARKTLRRLQNKKTRIR